MVGQCAGAGELLLAGAGGASWNNNDYVNTVVLVTAVTVAGGLGRKTPSEEAPRGRRTKTAKPTKSFGFMGRPRAGYTSYVDAPVGSGRASLVGEYTHDGRSEFVLSFAFYAKQRQFQMLEFHANLKSPHGYQSSAKTWLLLKRPVSYHIEYGPNGEYGEVMATGSPCSTAKARTSAPKRTLLRSCSKRCARKMRKRLQK